MPGRRSRRAPPVSKLEKRLRQERDQFAEIRDAAKLDQSWSAVVAAQRQVVAISEKLDTLREARLAVKYEGLERLAHQLRLAEQSASWQAVAALNRQIQDALAEQRRIEAEAEASQGIDQMAPDELLTLIDLVVDELPDVYTEDIAAKLAQRLGMTLTPRPTGREVAEA